MPDRFDNIREQELPKYNVLGTYEGECADASITNKNGLDITRPVWENVFASDDYKQAIELGWYIGFLGHPEDPNCMDFRNACIVMRSGRIDDDGKVYGTFDLIDTPVGRVVKAFQDAGVVFGISVRGAGDIVSNSVDPETFVFRGFDLVTFPAYPDAIPTFSAIAASTDASARAAYKNVCAAVHDNLSEIHSAASIDVIQGQFASQSPEYSELEKRKEELQSEETSETSEDGTDEEQTDLEARCQVLQEKLEAMQKLYSQAITSSRREKAQNARRISAAERKLKRVSAIMTAQMREIQQDNSELQQQCILQKREFKKTLKSVKGDNLKYKQEIASSESELDEKDSIIASTRDQLSETVSKLKASEKRASNLDETIQSLRQDLTATTKLLKSFQKSYIDIYARAIGVDASCVDITATTSVESAKSAIMRCATTPQVSSEPAFVPDEYYEDDEDSLVTL